MKSALLVMKAEFVRQFVLIRRYWLGTLASAFMMIMIFLAIYTVSGGFSENRDVLFVNSQVVGYLFYYIIITFFSNTGSTVSGIIYRGLMEQYVINKLSLSLVIFLKTIIQLVFVIIDGIPIFLMMLLITGYFKIHISIYFIVTFILTIGGIYGLGLFMAGLILRFKYVEMLSLILMIVFLGMSAIPIGNVPNVAKDILFLMPFQKGIVLIKQLGVGEISVVPQSDLIFLLINSVFYLVFGLVSFKIFEYYTKKKGLLATY